MKQTWEKIIGEKEIIYVSIEDDNIVLLHVLEPKTRIEMRCKIKGFSREHEIAIRVKDYLIS